MSTGAVVGVPRCVVETSAAALLMTRLRFPSRSALAATAAIDLPAVVGLAEGDDLRALRASDPHENLGTHAHTSTAARIEVAPPVRCQAPSPGQRPRATRRLGIATPGPSSISRSPIDYEVTRSRPSSRRCTDSSGSRRSLTDGCPARRAPRVPYLRLPGGARRALPRRPRALDASPHG